MSDTSDFESADEEFAEAQKKKSKSRDKMKKESGVEKPNPAPDEGWDDEGWEDFDVNVDQGDIPNINTADAVTVSEEPYKVNKREDVKNEPKPKKADSASGQGGWDDFGDWEDDRNQAEDKEPPPAHSEKEFKDLAERLNALSDVGTPTSNNWSGWGVPNFISSGVSQITTHVSQGIAAVSNAIESGMIKDPLESEQSQRKPSDSPDVKETESMDKTNESDGDYTVKDSPDKDEAQEENPLNVFKIGKFVSSVSKLVETTGSAVVTGGIDTLEEIGKRTMRVLQGEDEGKKRLSTLLREAREYAERSAQSDTTNDQVASKRKPPQFEALFDDFQGLVHLEALEMLSKQCDMKIKSSLSSCEGEDLDELKETLDQVKEICELPERDEDENEGSDDEKFSSSSLRTRLLESIKDMGIKLQFDPIINLWDTVISESSRSVDEPMKDEINDVYQSKLLEDAENMAYSAISNLAQGSALAVQLLHRSTALLSVRERRSTADEADGLTQLTGVLISYIGDIASVYSKKLNEFSTVSKYSSQINELITTVFLEAEKGSSYMRDAFVLTIPILQVGAM